MKNRKNKGEWAKQVPTEHRWSPYRDYGWEPHQSVLPEFRDPSSHFMPYEREITGPANLSDSEEQYQTGIYTGKGPRNYSRSDERIYEEICERMTRHGQLDASNITVEVKNGEVTLDGSVTGRWAKRLAEDISDSVYGVNDVHNLLRLQGKDDTERWVDEVGRSGVYPASEAENAPRDAEAQGMKSWGQGERGAKGYEDHGESELHLDREE